MASATRLAGWRCHARSSGGSERGGGVGLAKGGSGAKSAATGDAVSEKMLAFHGKSAATCSSGVLERGTSGTERLAVRRRGGESTPPRMDTLASAS